MTKTELITLLVVAVGLWLLIQFTGLKFWHAAVVLRPASTWPLRGRVADQRPAARILAAFGH